MHAAFSLGMLCLSISLNADLLAAFLLLATFFTLSLKFFELGLLDLFVQISFVISERELKIVVIVVKIIVCICFALRTSLLGIFMLLTESD